MSLEAAAAELQRQLEQGRALKQQAAALQATHMQLQVRP